MSTVPNQSAAVVLWDKTEQKREQKQWEAQGNISCLLATLGKKGTGNTALCLEKI